MKPEPHLEPEIIVRRAKHHEHGHHGGAWKIAYADFVTAMMAFFMLLWIIGATNEDQRKGIADYFTPTVIQMRNSGGSNGMLGGRSLETPEGNAPRSTPTGPRPTSVPGGGMLEDNPIVTMRRAALGQRRTADDSRFRRVEQLIAARLAGDPTMRGLRGQLRLVRTRDGLRIDLVERADFAMFGIGTSIPTAEAGRLLALVASAVRDVPNRLTVRGHTDAIGYSGRDGSSNWSLSAARADVSRRLLVGAGVAPQRFRRIEGVADTEPFNPDDRNDPRNRRISVTLLYRDAG